MAAEKYFIFLRSGLNASLTLLFDLTICDYICCNLSGSHRTFQQSTSQETPGASIFSWLDLQLQDTAKQSTSNWLWINATLWHISRKKFELLWSYTVGNTWKDIQSSFLQAALTISVSPCSTQVLFRIFHVKYLIHAESIVIVLHQQNQSSWIALGFTRTHLLNGKSVLSWCWQEGWAVQQQQELSGLWSVTNYKTLSCTWS